MLEIYVNRRLARTVVCHDGILHANIYRPCVHHQFYVRHFSTFSCGAHWKWEISLASSALYQHTFRHIGCIHMRSSSRRAGNVIGKSFETIRTELISEILRCALSFASKLIWIKEFNEFMAMWECVAAAENDVPFKSVMQSPTDDFPICMSFSMQPVHGAHETGT